MLLKIKVQRNVGSDMSVGVNCGVPESLKAYLKCEDKLDSKIIPSLFFSAFFFLTWKYFLCKMTGAPCSQNYKFEKKLHETLPNPPLFSPSFMVTERS